jgi:hypothetical protein
MVKQIITLILGFVLLFQVNIVLGQECSGCDDPNEAANCGDLDCEFACSNCSNSAPPAPNIPVDNGVGVLIAAGIGLGGLIFYRAYRKNAIISRANL